MRILRIIASVSFLGLAGCGDAALCVRTGLAQRIGLPVGAETRPQVGGIDILEECDRPAPAGLQWASSDTTRARVDASGNVTGISVGDVDIIVKAGRSELHIPISIIPAIARVEITPRDTSVTIGDTIVYQATAFDMSGEPLPAVSIAISARDMWKGAGHGDDSVVYATDEPEAYPASFVNRLSLQAWREGTTHIVAEVIGRADSVRIRVRR